MIEQPLMSLRRTEDEIKLEERQSDIPASASQSAFQNFDTDSEPDPDGFLVGPYWSIRG